jgi:hypothetical protein
MALRDVADAALALERDIARGRLSATKACHAMEKGKGKRPLSEVLGAAAPVQGAPLAGGPARRGDPQACFHCGRSGHVARNCPSPRQEGPAQQRDPAVCYNCRQPGHFARDCPMPHRGGQGRGGGRGPAQGRGHQQQLLQLVLVDDGEVTPLPPVGEACVHHCGGMPPAGILLILCLYTQSRLLDVFMHSLIGMMRGVVMAFVFCARHTMS